MLSAFSCSFFSFSWPSVIHLESGPDSFHDLSCQPHWSQVPALWQKGRNSQPDPQLWGPKAPDGWKSPYPLHPCYFINCLRIVFLPSLFRGLLRDAYFSILKTFSLLASLWNHSFPILFPGKILSIFLMAVSVTFFSLNSIKVYSLLIESKKSKGFLLISKTSNLIRQSGS